jgi:hypothetical protein
VNGIFGLAGIVAAAGAAADAELKRKRLDAAKLYVAAADDPRMECKTWWTYGVCLDAVGGESTRNEQQNVRRKVDEVRDANYDFGEISWIQETLFPTASAAEVDEPEPVLVKRAILDAANAYLDAQEGKGEVGLTIEQAARDQGLDASPPRAGYKSPHVRAVGNKVRDLEAEESTGGRPRAGGGGGGEGDVTIAAAAGGNVDIGAGRRGTCGAKAGKKRKVQGEEYGTHGVSKEDYKLHVSRCAVEIHETPDGQKWRKAEQLSAHLKSLGCQVTARTLLTHSQKGDPSEAPGNTGGRYFSDAFEKDLKLGIEFLRAAKLPVFKVDVVSHAWRALVESGQDQLLHDLTDGWYRGFLRRMNWTTGHMTPIETTREAWLTPDNLEKYYDTAAKLICDAGIGHMNPAYNPNEPYGLMVIIDHPERMLSYDETAADLDQTTKGKHNCCRMVKAGAEDDGATTATKSSTHISAVGGCIGHHALPLYVCFGSGNSINAAWTTTPPEGNVLADVYYDAPSLDGGTHKQRLIALYTCNKKGSMNTEKCVDYLNNVLLPSLRKVHPELADEPGKQAIEFCDGCTPHLSYERLLAAREAGLLVCLRVPHTTSETQAQDTVHFCVFKPAYQRMKAEVHRRLEAGLGPGRTKPLTLANFGECLKKPWEDAFSRPLVISGWGKDGLWPFYRKCYWDARIKKENRLRAEAAVAERSRDVRALQGARADPSGLGAGGAGAGDAGAWGGNGLFGTWEDSDRSVGSGGEDENDDNDDDNNDDDNNDDDDDDDGGGGGGGGSAGARGVGAGARGGANTAGKTPKGVREALNNFLASQEQERLSQMTTSQKEAELKSWRADGGTARRALRAADDAADEVRSMKLGTSKDLQGMAANCDQGLELVKRKRDRASAKRDGEEEARLNKRQKARSDTVEANEAWEAAKLELRSGKKLEKFAAPTLKKLLLRLTLTAGKGKKEALVAELLALPEVVVAVEAGVIAVAAAAASADAAAAATAAAAAAAAAADDATAAALLPVAAHAMAAVGGSGNSPASVMTMGSGDVGAGGRGSGRGVGRGGRRGRGRGQGGCDAPVPNGARGRGSGRGRGGRGGRGAFIEGVEAGVPPNDWTVELAALKAAKAAAALSSSSGSLPGSPSAA